MHALSTYCQLGAIQAQLQLEDGALLACQQLLRVLPNRRWVVRGLWHDQLVVAKVFSAKDASRYATRDAAGTQLLAKAGIQTPALLWRGQTKDISVQDEPTQVLIYAAIVAAESADRAYHARNIAQRTELMTQLSRVLGQHHAARLRQTDLHLDNFLIQHEHVWSIDGDGIQQLTISDQQAYQDLARMISKIPILDQVKLVGVCLAAYEQQRGRSGRLQPAQLLAWSKQQHTKDAWRYAAKKVFRNCSDVIWQSTPHYALALTRTSGLAVECLSIASLEESMQQGDTLKAGNTCTVSMGQLGGVSVAIKRYNIKNVWHAFSRAWRASRAAHAWRNAHLLSYFGIATPAPLCMLETRFFGLRSKAYFVAAFSPWPDAMAFFQQTTDQQLRDEAVQQLVTLCYQCYLLQLSHGDMKASNLQITDTGQVVVLDLDSLRMHRYQQWALRAHVKDIRRLLQNWKADTSLYNALVNRFNEVYIDHLPLKRAGIAIS